MAIFRRERKPKIFGIENATQRNFKLQPKFVYVKSWFVVIFGINATSDISKLLYIISRAVSRVKFETILKYHEWYFHLSKYAKYHVQIILIFVYTATHKRFVIFTSRYFKISWNTTALGQSNCRNFSCSSIIWLNSGLFWFVSYGI